MCVSTEIMYKITSLADLYHAFLEHSNLFQTIENYVTPEKDRRRYKK